MTLCDLSSFFCQKGGGVSTYHRARVEWFSRQSTHRYVLVSPGPRFDVRRIAPAVWTVQVYGPRVSRDCERYRLLIDYQTVRRVVERFAPDVLETHDPWFSLPMGLMVRHRGGFRGLLSTYCHSDPIGTYARPRLPLWARLSKPVTRGLRWADRALHRLHGGCDAVFVASEMMRRRVEAAGVERVLKASFGVDPDLLRVFRRPAKGRKRLLYAGRLDADKEFDLVLDVLPALLDRGDVDITVAGAGRFQRQVASISHPRFSYLGHVADRRTMCTLYAAHDVLLAPGRFETFGLAALEAAAAGLLVVGPNEGGTGELLSQWRSPLVFTPGCGQAFRRRIEDAVALNDSVLVERGRALARTYGTWNDAVARHVAIYERMVGAGAEPVGRIA